MARNRKKKSPAATTKPVEEDLLPSNASNGGHLPTSTATATANLTATATTTTRNDAESATGSVQIIAKDGGPPGDHALIRPNKKISAAESLSMQFMKSLSGLCCQECGKTEMTNDQVAEHESELYNIQVLQRRQHREYSARASPLVSAPMNNSDFINNTTVETILSEYVAACRVYGCADRMNAGVMTTIRFGLPSLRVSGDFHDADMLALVEILLKHGNGVLRYIQRLDFTIAGKEGKLHKKLGFTSHGAFALSKVLQTSQHIQQILLPGHRIGPYGASAIFLACAQNSTIQSLGMRRCRIQERGALVLAELLVKTTNMKGLVDVDLSANGMGYRGKLAIERSIDTRLDALATLPDLEINLEGNLVLPEIMNGCTHGLGVILSLIGTKLLADRVEGLSRTHSVTCGVYSVSLIVLYTSSTLYHSLFSLQATKYIFEVMDKCAIYILIAGSYTPFLQILLGDIPLYSIGFLVFLWLMCVLGIGVEAFYPTWQYRGRFSLAMYLGMGWLALFCLPELVKRLDSNGVNLIFLGGVGYTAGVPFFVRNNNMDHAIWHMFVLSGSVFHWFALYFYVAPMPLRSEMTV